MTTPKRKLEDLARLSDNELRKIFEAGTKPRAQQLAGWEFRGFAPALVAKVMSARKFKKGFFWKDARGARQLWGYTVPVIQDGLQAPWTNKHGATSPKRIGWFPAKDVDPRGKENKHENALLLDYGDGNNRIWDGVGFLRDYIVQVDDDNPDLYLGVAYVAVGPLRLPASFFILERLQKSDFGQ